MKRSLLSVGVVAAMLLFASAAVADEVQLTWNSCLADGGANNIAFACNSNTGNRAIVAAAKLTTDLLEVLSDEVVIDLVATTAPALPDWWALRDNAPLGYTACRNGALSIATQDGPGCPDIFALQGSMNIAAFQPDKVIPGSARILSVNAVPSTDPVNLIVAEAPDGVWAIGRWTINNARTLGTPSCAGCATPVCIVFNSVNITVVGNTNNRLVTGGVNDRITFQGAGADCNSVPVKNVSWGRVKSLYR